MKAIYTEAAQQELVDFQARQQDLLERVVAERKFVLGDDVLEITASDIKAASEKIQAHCPTSARGRFSDLVMRAYIGIGVVMMGGAFLYPQLSEIFASNKTQGLVFVVGASMTVVGALVSYWTQSRQKRRPENRGGENNAQR